MLSSVVDEVSESLTQAHEHSSTRFCLSPPQRFDFSSLCRTDAKLVVVHRKENEVVRPLCREYVGKTVANNTVTVS